MLPWGAVNHVGPAVRPGGSLGVRVCFKYFRSKRESWDALFGQAALFASGLGPERLISISHSCTDLDGVVTVWYWDGQPAPRPEGAGR